MRMSYICFAISPSPQPRPGDRYSVSMEHHDSINEAMKKVGKEGQKFERLEMKKEDLLKMFRVWRRNTCVYC